MKLSGGQGPDPCDEGQEEQGLLAVFHVSNLIQKRTVLLSVCRKGTSAGEFFSEQPEDSVACNKREEEAVRGKGLQLTLFP